MDFESTVAASNIQQNGHVATTNQQVEGQNGNQDAAVTIQAEQTNQPINNSMEKPSIPLIPNNTTNTTSPTIKNLTSTTIPPIPTIPTLPALQYMPSFPSTQTELAMPTIPTIPTMSAIPLPTFNSTLESTQGNIQIDSQYKLLPSLHVDTPLIPES